MIGSEWEEFKERAREGEENPEAVLDELGVDRHCCRRMLVSHEDLVDVVSPYQ
ncbi:DNA-directed RNA polymerase subunit N [Halorhabdus sp. BNX81]|nr:DNA-directed RNA polymerase subunit N [Halorhabdus sp. BNX81]